MASSRPHSIATAASNGSIGGYSFEEGGRRRCKPRLSIPSKGGRDRSPGLQWHKEYDKEGLQKGRILMIDYIKRDLAGSGTRKVIAQELPDVDSLKAVYKDGGRSTEATLRLFHVQNCPWATKFLMHKFRIQDNDNLVGLQDFGDWLEQNKPPRRAGKPLLVGKTWKTTSDPWRGVTKCSMGLDYMKPYPCNDAEIPVDKQTKVLGLMGYDQNDNPVHRYDVYSQRLSLYVQYHSSDLPSPGPDIVSPYHNRRIGSRPLEQMYDNGNTIIIFDNSDSHSINDTLITARGEWESRWRRLPFYIVHDKPVGGEAEEDEDIHMTLDLMKIVTQDVFKGIVDCWDRLLDVSWEHITILEEKIYEQPEDESRAPELWKNSAHWLKYEKLMFYHIDCVNDMRKFLVEIDGDLSDEGQWLKESPEDFERLSNLIQEDLVKRTNNLSELMYRSVGIRDSRQSLQLGTSMWRLSWVTFIFLPLTFITGFFGMNVDVFKSNPSIKWYFIVVPPFLATFLASWYLLKHWLARHRQTPTQRGVYEAFFTELHNQNPRLWSRLGPREYIKPKGYVGRFKWFLMEHWTSGKAAPRGRAEDEPIGGWNRIKRYFIRTWTNQIVLPSDPESAISIELNPATETSADVISGGSSSSGAAADVGGVDEDDVFADEFEVLESAGGRNSGVLVEERKEEDTGVVRIDTGDRLKVPGEGG